MSADTPTTPGLRDALRRWCEALEALHLTLTEDRPNPDSALADGLADATDDVLGWLHEAEANLGTAEGLGDAPRLLALAVRRQGEGLFGSEHQLQLERLARTRGGAWQAWVRAIRVSADQLWSCAETALQRLGPARVLRSPEMLTQTTYPHFTNSDSINPSAH